MERTVSKVLFAIEDRYMKKAIEEVLKDIPEVQARFEDSGIDAIKTLIANGSAYKSIVLYSEKMDMGVIDVARLIRHRFKKLPIAILASYDDIHTRIKSTPLGRVYFIGKNFDAEEMNSFLHTLEEDGEQE